MAAVFTPVPRRAGRLWPAKELDVRGMAHNKNNELTKRQVNVFEWIIRVRLTSCFTLRKLVMVFPHLRI